jgi:hypothetical protein
VLAYAHSRQHLGPKSYRYWYDQLNLPAHLANRVYIRRVTRLTDAQCYASEQKIRCSLFRVQPI